MNHYSASITQISPTILFPNGFELADQQIIPNENLTGSFTQNRDKIEFFIYDANLNLVSSSYNFTDWIVSQNTSTGSISTNIVELNPISDIFESGYDVGTLYAVYNFITPLLSSSLDIPYYLSEISSDRTEIRIKSNIIPTSSIANSFIDFSNYLVSSTGYFDEFYISFGNNEYHIGINALLDVVENSTSILIKLYDPLPDQYQLKDILYVAAKPAETQAYKIDFIPLPFIDQNIISLQGPNTDVAINDFVNNSTTFKSYSELYSTPSSTSLFNLQSVLNQNGVEIIPNYSYNTFNEFVRFSSAEDRVRNFYYKVGQIEKYQNDINTLLTITGSTSSSFQTSASVASLYTKIGNIITNFDGYEYYLYYESSSYAYPKSSSVYPYILYPTSSVTTLTWLGSTSGNSPYYGGILLSASLYDENNSNWLYYLIPEFIRNNSDNDAYISFINMMGQHFDDVWLYTKTITQKLNTTNELYKGIPLKLAEEIITSLGFSGYGNNYNNIDTFIGLIGEDNGQFTPATGSELITQFISINKSASIPDYWSSNYPSSSIGTNFPYPIDEVSKEIYKRLYHNMSYLVKKKGTISGLRQLINIWGVPNTILRINEFGGKNRDNTNDWDQWYDRYSYAYTPVPLTQSVASSSVRIPWMPLERNRIATNELIVPDSIQFRFKTHGYPSSSIAGTFFSQSLLVKKSDNSATSTNFDFGIALYYTGSTSGSYSGSSASDYRNWGIMKLYISGSSANGGTAQSSDIYLPFFDGGWWSVMLQRNQHVSASNNTQNTTYTLYAKNNIYDGWDGNGLGYQGSASIISNVSASINQAWNKFGTGSNDGIYLGGFVSGSTVGSVTISPRGKIFSGSLQEFRYYGYPIGEGIFDNFVMNPESIEGTNLTGSLSSFDIVNFRAPLGNELESVFTSSLTSLYSQSFTSYHPAITGSAGSIITGSFYNPGTSVTSSTFDVIFYANSSIRTFSIPNVETYFLNQPAIGIRNVVTNKIQVVTGSIYGNVLSNQISIQQDYQISRSYTENINSLEVSFSPQDEINDDIIQSYGFANLTNTFADPRAISSSSDNYYPALRAVAEQYFQKYSGGNIYDYLRLIKYIDNSLFKAIKSYVPARTSVSTGIVIKQHLLERNRYETPTPIFNTQIATATTNTPINYQNLELTSSISVVEITGSAGGSVNKFNYSGSPSFFQLPITQSWYNTFDTISGSQTITESYQSEFYTGQYSGSILAATTQSLVSNNVFLEVSGKFFEYNLYFYSSSYDQFNIFSLDITSSVFSGDISGSMDFYAGSDTSLLGGMEVLYGNGGTTN